MVRWNLVRGINLATGRDKPPVKRVVDPERIYRELISSGTIAPGNALGQKQRPA
jgi:hypothetical protein